MEVLVLFDGNGIIHRAFHAVPPFTIKKTGETVGAVYGFASMLLKVMNDVKPSHCAIAFDMKGPTFRHEIYTDYKATRKATPSELKLQFNRVREVVNAFQLPIFEMSGFEADDVLGALSQQAAVKGLETIIVTGDGDAMQLVGEHVKVMYPKPGKSFGDTTLYDAAAVKEKYGVAPEHIPDLKGLVGDTSDNIPGVKGIGDKTGVKLIQQFGSIEQIYEHISEVTPPRVQALLRENEAEARRSKVLATIRLDVPVALSLADCQAGYDRDKAVQLFRELEFFSLITRLPATSPEAPHVEVAVNQKLVGQYEIIRDTTTANKIISGMAGYKSIAVSVKGTSQEAMTADIKGIAVSSSPGQGYYFAVENNPDGPRILGLLKPVLENANLQKSAYNGKYDIIALKNAGIAAQNLSFDVMVAAHLIGDKALDLDEICLTHLMLEKEPAGEAVGKGAKQLMMLGLDDEEVGIKACQDADIIFRLVPKLDAALREQEVWKLFNEVEMPLIPTLVHMEMNGVKLDTAKLKGLSVQTGDQIKVLEQKIYNIAGEFNINSPQQLGQVLFDKLGIISPKKGKAKLSTEASVLEEIKDDPNGKGIVDLILEIRGLSKLKSTYIDSLPTLINPKTGRVHTSFNQTRTSTGRLSSTDPNLQNIPVKAGLGRDVRRAFIAAEGKVLLAADYSQIDLRALAHLSRDPELMHAFQNNEDIHTETASNIFGVPHDQVTPEMRRLAKVVNFGVIDGMSGYGLEQKTGLSRQEAGQYIDKYFEKYAGVKQYLESTKEQARKFGWVQTLLGRRRYIPEINSPNRNVREGAERMAINMPVQGTSADIIKVAMIDVLRQMELNGLKSKMLLQVHDELVFEVPQAELETMTALAKEKMCRAVELSIPLKVETKTGLSWGDME